MMGRITNEYSKCSKQASLWGANSTQNAQTKRAYGKRNSSKMRFLWKRVVCLQIEGSRAQDFKCFIKPLDIISEQPFYFFIILLYEEKKNGEICAKTENNGLFQISQRAPNRPPPHFLVQTHSKPAPNDPILC